MSQVGKYVMLNISPLSPNYCRKILTSFRHRTEDKWFIYSQCFPIFYKLPRRKWLHIWLRIFNSFLLRQRSQSALTFNLQWTFLGYKLYSIICILFTYNENQKSNRCNLSKEIDLCNTLVREVHGYPFFLLTYNKTTYFALGRISWPFLYHLSSTVGSASSTMNLTLPPLSTWYAGSRPLAKAVVEAKCYYKRRSENKNMNAEMTLQKPHQSCQNTCTWCYASIYILRLVHMNQSIF